MKRTEILANALKYFAIHGYTGCSMQQIADSVGINKATLYHYYESKQELFFAVFDIQIANFVKNFAQISSNLSDNSLRSIIFRTTHQLISNSTLEEIMFIKGTQSILASNAGADFIQKLLERLTKCNMDIHKALTNQLLSYGLDMQQEWGEKFFASYFIFLNGFLDWTLVNAYVANQDVTATLDRLLNAFWDGCRSLFPTAS